MTIQEAMEVLAELREECIAASANKYPFKQPENKALMYKRVQAIDVILDAMKGGFHDES